MKIILEKLISSFDNTTKGFSSRKLSAFVVMLCVLLAHGAWLKHAYMTNDFMLLGEILLIDYGFIAVCLGMTTWEKTKLGKNENTTNTDSSTKSE